MVGDHNDGPVFLGPEWASVDGLQQQAEASVAPFDARGVARPDTEPVGLDVALAEVHEACRQVLGG